MSQHDQHLTNEELSALLDEQFPSEVQEAYRAHVQTCERCQQALAGLRQTVALLHALPQPALPRSFVLPVSLKAASTTEHNLHLATAQQQNSSVRRSPGSLRGVLQFVSGLAAVVGIIFIISGLLALSSHPLGATTSAQSTSNAQNVSAGRVPAAGSGVQTPTDAIVTLTPGHGLQPDARPHVVAAPTANAGNQTAYGENNSSPFLPVLLFFDLSTAGGRMGLGLFLVIAGGISLAFLAQRRKRLPRREEG